MKEFKSVEEIEGIEEIDSLNVKIDNSNKEFNVFFIFKGWNEKYEKVECFL